MSLSNGGATPLHLVLVAVLLFAFPIPYFRQEVQLAREATSHKAHADDVRELGERLRRDPNPLAAMAIQRPGLVKYISGKTVIDLSGRCNPTIASLSPEAAAAYVLDRKPRYIALSAGSPQFPEHPDELGVGILPIEDRLYHRSDLLKQCYPIPGFRATPVLTTRGYFTIHQRRAD